MSVGCTTQNRTHTTVTSQLSTVRPAMYRLLDETKNTYIHRSIAHRHGENSIDIDIVSLPQQQQEQDPAVSEQDFKLHSSSSPPRKAIVLPFDEVAMDQVSRQQERLRMRSSFIEGGSPGNRAHQQKLYQRHSLPQQQQERQPQQQQPEGRRLSDPSPSTPPMKKRDSLDRYSMASRDVYSGQQQLPPLPQQLQQQTPQNPPVATSNTGGGANSQRKPRKSRPWNTDLKMNRGFGSNVASGRTLLNVVPSNSTQRTTQNYKMQMRERKTVFGSVAVMEEKDGDSVSASMDEDDDEEQDEMNISIRSASQRVIRRQSYWANLKASGLGSMQEEKVNHSDNNNHDGCDDDSDEESRGDEDVIHKEAHELLKTKGIQGILQQRYNDDLESVGPSSSVSVTNQLTITASSSGSTTDSVTKSSSSSSGQPTHSRQVLQLDDIQKLRQKILLQQIERGDASPTNLDNSLNRKDSTSGNSGSDGAAGDDEEPYDQATSLESKAAAAAAAEAKQASIAKQQEKHKERIEQEQLASSNAPAADDNSDVAKAWRVMRQLKGRLQDVFTEDHSIIEAMGRKGQEGVVATSDRIVVDTQAFDRYKLRDAVEKRVSQVFTGDHLIVCNGKVERNNDDDDTDKKNETLEDAAGSLNGDSDDNGEPAAKSPKLRERLSCSFQMFEEMLKARQQASVAGDDDWTECSGPAVANTTVRGVAGMIPPSLPSTFAKVNGQDDDDQSCWTEYTIETADVAQTNDKVADAAADVDSESKQSSVTPASSTNEMKEESGCQDDNRATVKMSNEQRVNLTSILSGHIVSSPDKGGDDETYAEYTVQEATVQPTTVDRLQAFRLPGQAPLEVAVKQDQDDQSYMEMTVLDDDEGATKREHWRGTIPEQPNGDDDQSFMEMTVQESDTAPPTRWPPQLSQTTAADDQSYMEVTVQDATAPPDRAQGQQFNDLTSPHMANMLSSRMFADMELPEGLKQQQAQKTVEEENHDSYPTITVGHFDADDDDMTQLTFDHTMMEDYGPSDYDNCETDFMHDSSNKQVRLSMATLPASGANTNQNFADSDFPSVVGSQHTEHTRDTTVSDDGSSSHHDGASFKSCVSTESSQFVADLLRRDIWSPDPVVVQSALETLSSEAARGVNNRSHIVRYGGLLAILRAMELKPDHSEVQVAACIALEKMASDAVTQVAIGKVGGIPAIANAMEGHANDVAVQRAACKALSRLTKQCEDSEGSTSSSAGTSSGDEKAPAAGIVKAVTDSMKVHAEDSFIQEHAFGTLANLCLDNQDQLRELKKMGGLATMTTALQVPWESETSQHEAISTLSILLRSLASLGH